MVEKVVRKIGKVGGKVEFYTRRVVSEKFYTFFYIRYTHNFTQGFTQVFNKTNHRSSP